MTKEDAVALITVSLEALAHRRLCIRENTLKHMPVGPLTSALAQLEESGADTVVVRVDFKQAGFDLSTHYEREILSPAQRGLDSIGSGEPDSLNAGTDTKGSGSSRGSRVPPAIAEAVRVKFQQGWSKSQIAREFRLNRRTVILICAAG